MVDKSIILTDDVIDDLLDDWFERDGETFAKIRKDGRVGWEDTLEEGDSYSAYLLEAPTQEDLIKRAYVLARDTITSMNTPFKVRVKISLGDDSYTDGKILCASTKMFDDVELSVGEKLDTFLGVTIHEGCHLLYTDFGKLSIDTKPIIHTIFNIIEDERIEQLCGDEKPGLVNFLAKAKYYYFDQVYLDYMVPKEAEGKLTPFDRIMNCFLHIIRYPKYLKENEIIEFGHYLIAIKKVLHPYPESTQQSLEAAEKVFEIIKDFYKDTEREKSEADGESGGESSGGGKTPEESDAKAMEELEKDAKDMVKVLSILAKDSPSEDGKSLSVSDASEKVSKDGGLLGEICEGKVEIGGDKETYFFKESDAKELYLDSLSRVKRYIPAISKILKGHCKEYRLIHRSMRSGVLDCNKLSEAYQGVPTVYLREGEVKTDKVSVCVLIDESGSMAGSRIVAARDAAILINEAIGNTPNVELFIYGHSGDVKTFYSTELHVYREKGYAPKYSLGGVKARYQNRDGVAILEVANRVRKQTKNPVLFFILSDGEPCAGSYTGESAIRHVKECVQKTEKMGFNVIQVCINHVYDPGRMFKHYVIMDNMSSLSFELGKAIKKSTMNAAKVNII